MEKFKDFLYNKNDVIIALIILVIAISVIAFRLLAIMEYPKTLAEQQNKQVQNVQQVDKSKTNNK